MKKLILFLMTMLLAACSAPMSSEDVGEAKEPLTWCSITGSSGSVVWPEATVITGIAILPFYNGARLLITSCYIDGSGCLDATHIFNDVSWSKVNLDYWSGTLTEPLRRVKVEAPGCQLGAGMSDKYCMTFYGDTNFGDHVNLLQNATRFLSDKPITLGDIQAPVGYGIAKIVGYGSYGWQMRLPNASLTGMATHNWLFTLTNCP